MQQVVEKDSKSNNKNKKIKRFFPRYDRNGKNKKLYRTEPREADEKRERQTRTKTRVRLTAVRTRELILRGAPSCAVTRTPSRHELPPQSPFCKQP